MIARVLGICLVCTSTTSLWAQVQVAGEEEGQGIPRLRGVDCTVITVLHVLHPFAPNTVRASSGVETTGDAVLRYRGEDVAVLELAAPGFPCDGWSPPPSLDDFLDQIDGGGLRIRHESGAVDRIPVIITGHSDQFVKVRPSTGLEIRQTHSGSPLYSEGQLIGMLVTVNNGEGKIIRADRLEELVGSWYGTVPGECTPSTLDDSSRWVTIEVSGIPYLPPVPDNGDPDYYLVLTTEAGQRVVFNRIYVGRVNRTGAIPRADLLGSGWVELSIIEEDGSIFGASEEDFVKPLKVPSDQLVGCRSFELSMLESIFRHYPNIDPNRRTISMTIKVTEINPDRASGPDASQDAPNVLPPGTTHADAIDFDRGDAVDHVRVRAVGGFASAVVWLEEATNVSVEWAGPPGDAEISSVFRTTGSFNRETEILVLSRRDGLDLSFGVRAEAPRSEATYRVYAPEGATMPARGRQLLSQIIAESATNASFGFDEPPVGAPVAVLRRAFGTDAGEVIQVLETDLMSRGISSANEDPRFPSNADQARRRGVHHAFAILVEEFDMYLGQPLGDDVQTVRQMLVILQAEQMGAVPDRSWLTRGLSSPNDIIAVRAVKAVGALGDRDYAESVLTDLVLSDRSDVADAARDVLRAMREDDLPPIPAARAQMMDVHDLPTDVGQAAS